jgi:RimJ/RimL family protein N-acetyltransferase
VHAVHLTAERTIIATDGRLALSELLYGERQYVEERCETTWNEDPDDRPLRFYLAERWVALTELASGELLGTMVWRTLPYGDTVNGTAWNVGIHLLPVVRGRGVSTAAGRLLIRHLFQSTDAYRLEANTDVTNVPGRRGLEKIGFQCEGVTRGVQLRGGKRRDMFLYSLIRSDLDPDRTVLLGRDGVVLTRSRPGDRAEVAGACGALILDQDPRLAPPAATHRASVLDGNTGGLIGTVSWRAVDYGGSLAWRITTLLVPQARGRGVGSIAQRLLAEYLFSATELDRVEAGAEVDSPAERHSLEQAGFRCDGVVRGARGRGSRRRDVALYSILRTDI